MQTKLAETAGFCFGVDRAVALVEQAVREGKRVATLGPIIHNRHVIERFKTLGVREIAAPAEAAAGECVVIRSHGVSRAVMEALEKMGVEIVDATCPFVKKSTESFPPQQKTASSRSSSARARIPRCRPLRAGAAHRWSLNRRRNSPPGWRMTQNEQKFPYEWSAKPPVRRIYGKNLRDRKKRVYKLRNI